MPSPLFSQSLVNRGISVVFWNGIILGAGDTPIPALQAREFKPDTLTRPFFIQIQKWRQTSAFGNPSHHYSKSDLSHSDPQRHAMFQVPIDPVEEFLIWPAACHR